MRERMCVCLCNEKYISRTQNVKRKRKQPEFIKFKNGKGENLKRKISASILGIEESTFCSVNIYVFYFVTAFIENTFY